MPNTIRHGSKPRNIKARRMIAASAAVAAAGASAAFAVQYAAADEPEAQQTCVFEALPVPEGLESTRVKGMSDDGSVIAYYAEAADPSDPDAPAPRQFLYAGGETTEVPMLNDYAYIDDVNAEAVGVGWAFQSGYVPFVWRDGELTELPTENGGQAHAINEHGDIVGSREGEEGPLPVLWPADGTGPVDLPLPDHADEWGEATAIGDDGTIVGHYVIDDGEYLTFTPYVWHPDGTSAELPVPEGADPADVTGEVHDLKGEWASGFLTSSDRGITGVRWNLTDGTAEWTGLRESVAVTADGTVAGQLNDPRVAAYQTGDTVVELPGALDPAEADDRARFISADGSQIAGDVLTAVSEDGAYLYNAGVWTCE